MQSHRLLEWNTIERQHFTEAIYELYSILEDLQ